MIDERNNDDQILQCVTCWQRFAWTRGEQRYYAERDLSPPRRCPACREARRIAREQAETASDAQEWHQGRYRTPGSRC